MPTILPPPRESRRRKPWWDVSRPHYSVSSVGSYLRCAAQVEASRIEHVEGEPPPAYFVRGSSVHVAGEENHKQKIESRVDMKVGDLCDITATEFDARVREEGVLLDPKEDVGQVGALKDQAVEMTKLYHRDVAPKIQPIAAERRFRIAFENVPYQFVGSIDVLDTTGRVVDLKTKKRKDSAMTGGDHFQLSAYSLAEKMDHGALPPVAEIVSMVATADPTVVRHEFKPTDEDLRLVLSTIAAVDRGWRAGSFPPNRASFLCSRRHCSYWKWCEAKHGGRVRD